MKRLVALLLVMVLLMTGCALRREDRAVPVEKTEKEDSAGITDPSKLPSEQVKPSEKEESSAKEQKPSEKEESAPSGKNEAENGSAEKTFQAVYQDMPFAEAASLTKAKTDLRSFNKKLTDEQRMALYLFLRNENTLYLAAQSAGLISNFKYAEGEAILNIAVYTTEEAVGTDLLGAHPLKLSGNKITQKPLDQKVLGSESIPGAAQRLRYIIRETEDPKDYLPHVSYPLVTPKGLVRHRLKLGEGQSVSKALAEQILLHYLSIEEVVWVELSFAEKEEKSDPAKLHKFWEWEEELSYEQARTIALEKIYKRFDERLSLRERKAFYLLTNTYAEYIVQKMTYVKTFRLSTTKAGLPLNPLTAFPNGWEGFKSDRGAHLAAEYSTVQQNTTAEKNELFFINIPEKSNAGAYFKADYLSPVPIGKFTVRVSYGDATSKVDLDEKAFYSSLLRHYWSIDCITWVELEHRERYPGLRDADPIG